MERIGHVPQRTCIGCRGVADRSSLLRLVAIGGDTGTGPAGPPRVLPDERADRPGRGAWLHPARECFDLAVRRRAFARALRVGAAPDLGPVLAWMTQQFSPADADGETKNRKRV